MSKMAAFLVYIAIAIIVMIVLVSALCLFDDHAMAIIGKACIYIFLVMHIVNLFKVGKEAEEEMEEGSGPKLRDGRH